MFCPTCANTLEVEEGPNCLRFSCSTCPYVQNIKHRISNKTYPKLKEVIPIYYYIIHFIFIVFCYSTYGIPQNIGLPKFQLKTCFCAFFRLMMYLEELQHGKMLMPLT